MCEVSVVLPFHRVDDFLAQSVMSVLTSEDIDFELVLVADGSAKDLVDSLVYKPFTDKRIRIISNPGEGIVAALNFGISLAGSDFIARMDSDDICHPARLRQQLDTLKKIPKLSLIGCQVTYICVHGHPRGTSKYPDLVAQRSQDKPLLPCVAHPAVMFRKELFNLAGGYREGFAKAEDLDLWNRLLELGDFLNIPRPLLQYRVHSGQVSVHGLKDQIESSWLCSIADQMRHGNGVLPSENLRTGLSLSFYDFLKIVQEEAPDCKKSLIGAYVFFKLRLPNITRQERRQLLFLSIVLVFPVAARYSVQVTKDFFSKRNRRQSCDLCLIPEGESAEFNDS